MEIGNRARKGRRESQPKLKDALRSAKSPLNLHANSDNSGYWISGSSFIGVQPMVSRNVKIVKIVKEL